MVAMPTAALAPVRNWPGSAHTVDRIDREGRQADEEELQRGRLAPGAGGIVSAASADTTAMCP